jgi:hypothetical protein
MAVAFGDSFEGGFPMRLVLVVIALASGFILWDRLENEGRVYDAGGRQLPTGGRGSAERLRPRDQV